MDGPSIGGRDINYIRYEDDTVLVADSVEKLQALVSEVHTAREDKCLRIIKENTERIVVSKRNENSDCVLQVHQEPIKSRRVPIPW